MEEAATRTTLDRLRERFGGENVVAQETADGIDTFWAPARSIVRVLDFLKTEVPDRYCMLYDLTAIDERERASRPEQPRSDFTVVYHLLSLDRGRELRIKVALEGERPVLPSATRVWPSANWYEREVWDMFGIRFEGHPHLCRILMPVSWKGHPLRKDHHPARATEMADFDPAPLLKEEQDALRFRPEEWGLEPGRDGEDFMFLNVGPQHPGTHGVLRIILQLAGDGILDALPALGPHPRGAAA